MSNKIYSTVGVYGNGECKVNGVKIENIPDHIKYNINMRPGRALFVNGICIHHGFLRVDEVLKWQNKIMEDKETFWRDKDTQPYE